MAHPRLAAATGTSTLKCAACGTEIKRANAHIRSENVSCSVACAQKVKRRKPKTLLDRTCQQCGSAFQIRLGRGGTGQFCSVTCTAAWRGARMRKENHPNWRGGASHRTYAERKAIKQAIERDGACVKCGATKQLQGHHVLHKSTHPNKAEDLDNIVTLCAACHAIEHPKLRIMVSKTRQKTGADIACLICGALRYVRPSALKTAKYCSNACALAGLHQRLC